MKAFKNLLILSALFIFSCKKEKAANIEESVSKQKLFTSVSAKETGVDFINVLEETTMPTHDRTQWLYDTAYTQWKMGEINTGEVHKRLL